MPATTRIAIATALLFAGWLCFALSAPIWLGTGFLTAALFALLSIWLAVRDDDRAIVAQPPSAPQEPEPGLLEGLPQPVMAIDMFGKVQELNAAARAQFPGLQRGEPLTLGVRHPQLLEAVEAVHEDGEERRIDILQRVPVEKSIEAVINWMPRNQSATATVIVSLHDTTLLRRAETMRADFVANASHELRTPLASIMGFVETLQGAARNDPVARDQFLGIMAEQGRRMSRLIDDLLSLSKIELNEHLQPSTQADLEGVIRGITDGLAKLAMDNGVTLMRAPFAGNTIIPRGEADELSRVFENLIENAIKYGGPGTVTIRIVEDEPGRRLGVAIEDEGPGIAPEHVPRLTERFYRVDAGSSRSKGGTGLGLAIVKHILNRHRGKLEIRSTPGQGSTFTVWLPL